MATKFIARLDGRIVGNRTSKERTYTHAIVINGHHRTDHVATWCGRLDLAQGEQRKYQRAGFRADIVPAEIAEPVKGRAGPLAVNDLVRVRQSGGKPGPTLYMLRSIGERGSCTVCEYGKPNAAEQDFDLSLLIKS